MDQRTRELWAQQDRHEGDRWRLFTAVAAAVPATAVLYPGSFVDVAPSFVFPAVTYVDTDPRAARFFADEEGVFELVAAHEPASPDPRVRFIHADYTTDLALPDESFDLLVSMYAGLVSGSCTRYLAVGGTLLVNPSHGDAAAASIDPRYRLSGVVVSRSGDYRVTRSDLDGYMVPKSSIEITSDLIRRTGRGVAYTKPAFAYLFTRVR